MAVNDIKLPAGGIAQNFGTVYTGSLSATSIRTSTINTGVLRAQKGFYELTSSEYVESFNNSELPKLKQMIEDAKMMAEEEDDPDSFGEYQGLQMAYDWLVKSLVEARVRTYSVDVTPQYATGGLITNPFPGHTGIG